MHSVSDLTTFARRTTGDVPPPLVGASTTVVGDKMYLFGGRLVSLRKMVSDMYEFDLKAHVWTKIEPKPDEEVPGPRYFHSADAWNDHLVIFGGMGYTDSASDELCVLSDVRVFSLSTLSWLPPTPVQTASAEESIDGTEVPPPRARYAHLSSITSSRLFIIGGQNLSNDWLDDIHVYDLPSKTWVMWKPYPRHCGTYRSVAVCAQKRVRNPSEEMRATLANHAGGSGGIGGGMSMNGTSSPPPQGYPFLGPVGARFAPERTVNSNALMPRTNHGDTAPDGPTPTRELVHLPYSCDPTENFPNDVFLYSNYNFTDVRRELEVLTPLPNHDFAVDDRSNLMTGNSLPPGLRFPTGAILGHHLVIAGTYLAHSYQSFSIWALDLVSMTWSRIDPGATLASGSWSRGVLWENANKFLIFGNKDGNLVEDYNRRLLSWDHIAYIDLEAFGIYQPPELALSLAAQELGLAALEEGTMADFELVCDDGRRISCSRRLLENRWPWFRDRRKEFVDAVTRAMEAMPNGGKATGDVALPKLPGTLADIDKEYGRPDPRLTPRAFHLSEPYPVTLAFLQWMYAQAIITRLQHTPPVLSALLLLATTYRLDLLEKQVRHAMHRSLNAATSVGVYEVATLCDSQSLQIRALKVVMSSSRQRSNNRPRHQGGPSGSGGMNGPSDDTGARPRGMSDAPNMRRPGEPQRGPSGSGYTSAPQTGPTANGYVSHQSERPYPQQLKLAITMPSNDGHSPDLDEGPRPDPNFKFGVTTPYVGTGPGAAFFDTHDQLPSAIEPSSQRPARGFQPRRKDSSISGAGSDSGSSTTNLARFLPKKTRDATLRPTTTETVVTDTDRTLIHPDLDDERAPTPNGTQPVGVADARMRRLLHELDSIGIPDEMTMVRPSLDMDERAAGSSVGHGSPPMPPVAMGKSLRHIPPPPGKAPPSNLLGRAEDVDRAAQTRRWANHTPNGSLTGRGYGVPPSRTLNHPDAPESASPITDVDDMNASSPYNARPDASPLMSANTAFSRSPTSQGTASPSVHPSQLQQLPAQQLSPQQRGVYQPVHSTPLNSAAFPMPPRGATSASPQQQHVPLVSRTPRRPGTAGNDPPVAFYNNPGGANRARYGSDQNLRERYLANPPQAAPSIAGSQTSQSGLSPISPLSAPALTMSSSGSRTNSTISGVLETPVEPPVGPPQPSSTITLDPIKEKQSLELTKLQDLKPPTAEEKQGLDTPISAGSGTRRGSLDSGMLLKSPPSASQEKARESGARSPIIEAMNSGAILHNPFLGGGFGGGLSFGGVGFAVKDKDPPPYRMHSPPSSGPSNGRTNSLRAASVGGKSDGSGTSSFGEGVSASRMDHGAGTSRKPTPAVALATAFVRDGVPGLSAMPASGSGMSKAEKAAEKARQKAEKAALKAEEARIRVEEEKEAKKAAEEMKKRRKQEKTIKRLQVGEMGVYGINGMGMIH